MSEVYFRKVLCSDRLPRKAGRYVTEYGNTMYRTDSTIKWKFDSIIVEPVYWLEEISLNQIKAEAWDECMDAIEKHEIDWSLWNLNEKPEDEMPPRPINPYSNN
jgi:hypothetical protein